MFWGGPQSPDCALRRISTKKERKEMEQEAVIAALMRLEEQIQQQEEKASRVNRKLEQLRQKQLELQRRLLTGQIALLRRKVGETVSLIDVLNQNADPREKRILEQVKEQRRDGPCVTGPTPEQSRAVKITIRLTQWEKDCVEENVCRTFCASLNDYARKMLVDGYVIAWDFGSIDALVKEVSYTNRSLNQIAKRVNLLNSVYHGDVVDLLRDWTVLRSDLMQVLTRLKRAEYLHRRAAHGREPRAPSCS